MHHIGVKKSNFGDLGSDHVTKFGFAGNDTRQPLCPKPRRLGPAAVPELLKPFKCIKHSQSNTTDGRIQISNIIDVKGNGESTCSGCLPTCYCGSPPDRTDNPLVHDVHFIHQMELLSPFTRTKLSDKFGFASASKV